MGMDLYAGTFTRYYAGNWKTEAQKWCEEFGFDYKKITPVQNSEVLPVEEILPMVETWRDNLLEALRMEGFSVEPWPEDNERPYYTNKPDWPAFNALLLYVACLSLNEPFPEKFSKTAQFKDFEISQRIPSNSTLGWSLIHRINYWLPLEIDVAVKTGLLSGGMGTFYTTNCLIKELKQINELSWKADDETIDSWFDLAGYEPEDEKRTKLKEGFSMVEPASGYYDTESLAKFAFSRFYRAARFAQENSVPLIMDF